MPLNRFIHSAGTHTAVECWWTGAVFRVRARAGRTGTERDCRTAEAELAGPILKAQSQRVNGALCLEVKFTVALWQRLQAEECEKPQGEAIPSAMWRALWATDSERPRRATAPKSNQFSSVRLR